VKLIERRTITQHVDPKQATTARRTLAMTIIEKGHGAGVANILLTTGRAEHVDVELNRTVRFEWELVE